MITQAEVDKAKSDREVARNMLEAYWSGNPDGNYSVMGWLDELARCAASNRYIIVRNADLSATLNGQPQKGGCTAKNFSIRLTNFNDRVNKYYTAYADWKEKIAAYDKILKEFQIQAQTQVSQSQTAANQAETQIALQEAEAIRTRLYLYGGLAIAGVIILGILAYKLIRKLFPA